MGGYQLKAPELSFRKSPPTLGGNYTLRMDPKIQAEINAIIAGADASSPATSVPNLRRLMLTPNWNQLQQSDLDRALAQPLPGPHKGFSIKPGKGPAKPKKADVSTLLKAIWAVPEVKIAAERVCGDACRTAKKIGAEVGEKVEKAPLWSKIVVGGAVLTGATTTLILSDKSRELALDAVDGRTIPVPGVSGLSAQISRKTVGQKKGVEAVLFFDLAPYFNKL